MRVPGHVCSQPCSTQMPYGARSRCARSFNVSSGVQIYWTSRHTDRPTVGGKTNETAHKSIFDARSMPTKQGSCSSSVTFQRVWPLRHPSTERHGADAFTHQFKCFCL